MDALAQLNAALSGRYAVEREIGRGGMATVYLARDLRHDRRVAVKVLNPELGAILGVERFLAEIRVTAGLQHPNLLALFDSGEARTTGEGTLLFYVMPYVDGESLRVRLDREKQLPVEEAVRIAVSIASALDYAHRQGVIHRDLKPENILLHEGQPLVADFGIALAVSKAGGARITQTGLSLGTPQYMSPEQATGDRAVNGRTDIYSLGAMLYEMLTGEPPHTGPTAQAIIARVINDRPRSVRTARDTVPEWMDHAILRALAKLPADRWSTAQAFADALAGRGVSVSDWTGAPLAAPDATVTNRRAARVRYAVAAGAALVVGGLGWMAGARSTPEPPVNRYALSIPDSVAIVREAGVAVSPDGSRLLFVAPWRGAGDTARHIWVKRRDRALAEPLAGVNGVNGFAFSPDGKWIAWARSTEGHNQIVKVAVEGGVPMLIADSAAGWWNSPAWLDDGTIVYAHVTRQLRQVADTGGAARIVWRSDTTRARHPVALPGSRGVAFIECMRGICAGPRLAVLDLRDGTTRHLADDVVRVQYAPAGQLIFLRADGTLHAVGFDARRLAATGQPVQLLTALYAGTEPQPWFSLSRNGTLVTWHGMPTAPDGNHQLYSYDRSGRAAHLDSTWTFRLGAATLGLAMWSISPDGRRLAIALAADNLGTVWTKELPDGPLSRLTFQEGRTAFRPRYTPDGRWISYFLTGPSRWDLLRVGAHGSGQPELLFGPPLGLEHVDWSRDGLWMVAHGIGPGGNRDLFVVQLGVDSVPRPLLQSRFHEQSPALSPDARWLAYQSNESGQFQVYLRPFPDVDAGKWQASRGDGTRSPVWSPDGRELFYIDDVRRELVAVPVTTTPDVQAGPPRVLATLPEDAYLNHFATLDGQRFLIARRVPAPGLTAPSLVVTENWTAELRRVVAGRR